MDQSLIVLVLIAILVIVLFLKSAVVVPQRTAVIVERLGKFNRSLQAGFHILIPFMDRVAYRRSMKEEVMDIPSQICITRDNVSVEIDGVIYLQVQDAQMSAYGIDDYHRAASQLAQTSLRSAIGKIDLDKTFEERETINQQVVQAVDEAAHTWGIKVLRYEIKDIHPPKSVMDAMESLMKADREKRAEIARSEGDRQSRINRAEGYRQEQILKSEGEKIKRINEAQGDAQQIELVAEATAEGLRKVAAALAEKGGMQAANLRVAEQYVSEFGNLARENNTMIVPGNLTDLTGMVAAAMTTMKTVKPGHGKKCAPQKTEDDGFDLAPE
ncbi:MAG: SPFH/Band 7/PHB domain protein [Proteobacteria bacterium]|nr:SPFH/Band 7/PHB domain protein [Pseudomonadota bacterium]